MKKRKNNKKRIKAWDDNIKRIVYTSNDYLSNWCLKDGRIVARINSPYASIHIKIK